MTVLVSSLVELPVAIAFLVVGTKFHRRGRIEGQPTLLFFAAFWVGIGGYALVESAWALSYLAGLHAMPVALFVLHMKIVASVVAFAGLVSFVLSIHGADKRVRGVVVGAYGILLALVETFYSWRDPIGQKASTWGIQLVYANNAVEPWWTLVLVLLFVPPLVAALFYAALLRITREREQRYRIALTSASLLLFFAPLLLGWRAGDWPWWGAVEKALAIAMAAGIVLATWPPAGVRAWLSEERAVARDLELRQRALELI